MPAQFSADFTLIAPGASSVTYDITLNAGQFSLPYAASLLLELADGEGTLNVTTHGTFNGFIILGAGVCSTVGLKIHMGGLKLRISFRVRFSCPAHAVWPCMSGHACLCRLLDSPPPCACMHPPLPVLAGCTQPLVSGQIQHMHYS